MEEHKYSEKRMNKPLLPILVLLIGMIVLVQLGYNLKTSQDALNRSKVELNAVTYAEYMKRDITEGIDITKTFQQILISENGNVNKFQDIAENMMTDFIQSIQLAPNGVVTEIYPEEGNEAGKIDLINDEERGEISRYSRDNHVTIMQGPFPLKQGSYGIAVRNPVYLEQEDGQETFWGFTIVIIRVPEIFMDSISALSEFGYDYRLSKNRSPWDSTYEEVYSSGADMVDAAIYSFEAGGSNWKLEVMPKGGWSNNSDLYVILGCGILIVFLLSGFIAVLILLRRARYSENKALEFNKKLQDTLEMVNAANVAKTKFINNMSHDIRTPMNAIIGYTTIALEHTQDTKTKKCLDKINESSEHLLTLINDVLDISRIESGKIKLNLVPVDITGVTDEVINITQGFIISRDLKLEIKRAEIKNPYVLADVTRIREVLVNILSNAVKFTDDGGTITFETDYVTGDDDKHIVAKYIVSDTGIGMSEEFQKHIFEEFTQESTDARTQYKGTGLGMAITKQYVEMMGGKITVHSKQGKGTTFIVEIPMELTNAIPAAKTNGTAKRNSLDGLNILLVEDNDLNAEIAQILLEKEKAAITRVSNGEQAVETFEKNPAGTFDLILMDIMMPQMNGYEATKAIRGLKNRTDGKEIPIIAMTANAFAEDIQVALDAGMNDHIAKPINIDDVIKTILRNL